MMEKVLCANCNVDDAVPTLSKWGMTLVTCRSCQLTYVNPRSFTVESDDYFRGPYLETIEVNRELRPPIRHLYSSILNDLCVQLRPGSLLDVGCAMGHFLKCARDSGWEVHGVECSPYAVTYAKARWGLSLDVTCDLQGAALAEDSFDACTLIEVVEHLPHPQDTLREIYRLLKPGGILYLTTPNFASFKSLLLREHWEAVIPAGHLYYFTSPSLRRLLRTSGFDRVWNLTAPASLSEEWRAIHSSGFVTTERLAHVAATTQEEDRSKVTNGRSEALRMVAFKPEVANGPSASRRFATPPIQLDGRLVTTGGLDAENQKVYLIDDGRKHWVTSAAWLTKHGRTLKETIQVSADLLASYYAGEPLQGSTA